MGIIWSPIAGEHNHIYSSVILRYLGAGSLLFSISIKILRVFITHRCKQLTRVQTLGLPSLASNSSPESLQRDLRCWRIPRHLCTPLVVLRPHRRWSERRWAAGRVSHLWLEAFKGFVNGYRNSFRIIP